MKKSFVCFPLLMIMSLWGIAVFAQEKRTITGVVRDSANVLQGASVSVKGAKTSTISDAQGRFRISASTGDVLVFNFVGYERKEVKISDESALTIMLNTTSTSLESVVVTALGITKDQRKLGYATTQLSGKDIIKSAPTNFASALYGKAPGVTINTNPGGATSAVSVQIRGINSLNYQRQPLLVVDGVVIRNGDANNEGYWGGNQKINGNGLLDINPENIETINILKGAAASALYGSDANFGVIVVTTKNGKGTKGFGVEVNISGSLENVAVTPDLQTDYGPGYDRTTNMALYGADDEGWIHANVNGQDVVYPAFRSYGQFGPKVDGRQVYWWDGQMRPYISQPNNWKKFYQQGYSAIENIAINHATDKMNYRFSYTRNDYKGIQISGKQEKNTFNFNSTYKIIPKISLDLVASYINEKVHNRPRQIYYVTNNYGGFFSPVDYMDVYFDKYQTSKGYKYVRYDQAQLDPEEAIKYNIRAYDFLDFLWNQLANSYDETSNRVLASATLNYNIAKGLNLRGRFGTDYTGYFLEEKDRSTQPIAFGPTGAYGTISNHYTYTYGDVLLSYQYKVAKDLNLSASVGYQARKEDYRYDRAYTRDGLTTENWFSLNASKTTPVDGTPPSINGTPTSHVSLIKDGLFGILNVDYHDFLFVEGTLRRERSSTLFPGNNTFYYPGVSAGFELSNAFHLPDFVTYSKLRAAWGIVGNPPDVYKSNIVYYSNPPGTVDGAPVLYPPTSGYGNQDLRNEEKHEFEVGWENKFFKNRLGFDITYYNDKIVDQILSLTTPASVGSSSVLVNVGTLRNYGVELSLYGTPYQNKSFKWDTRINLAFNRNKVVSLMEGLDQLQLANLDNGSMLVVAEPGKPAGDIVGYKRRVDAGGNYVINDAGYYDINFDEQTKFGNVQPTGVGGFINTVSYKNFSLNFLIDFRWGGQVISQALLYGTGAGLYTNSMFGRDAEHGGLAYYVDANGTYVGVANGANAGPNGEKVYHDGMILQGVKRDGSKNTTMIDAPSFYENTYSWGSWPGSGSYATYEGAVFDNDYIKMREASLSYTLPVSISRKWKMQNFIFTVFGRNLFYFYKSLPFLDPEEGVGTNWISQSTTSGQGTAATRSIGASIRVTF